ncbi:MAG: transposase [Chloroflexota bacterium]|nr:transposase [Chloroflexota bacterium]
MSLLAKFYNLSDRTVETFVNENQPAKYFVGLGIDHKAPDHSTLSVFQDRLIKNSNLNIFEEILEKIIAVAHGSGITFGTIQRIDREAYLG